jgi:hypothetical protein
MYVVLTKNSQNNWDAIHELDLDPSSDLSISIDKELEKGVPLVGMNVTTYKSKAVKGAKWNGSSFSGGVAQSGVPSDTDEVLSTREKYSFLSDNEIVVSFTIDNDYPQSEMLKAAFNSETILVKNTSRPLSKIGKTFSLNGLELELI